MRIFVDNYSGEGLYSIAFDRIDEYARNFKNWDNVEYVANYCIENEKFFCARHFNEFSIDDIIEKILAESEELQFLIRKYADEGFKKFGDNLQLIFVPLHEKPKMSIPSFEETKALIENKTQFPKPILRIYAVRINKNTFVVTGGAIKITKKMQDHVDTLEELEKFETVKNFLKLNHLNCDDDLLNFLADES